MARAVTDRAFERRLAALANNREHGGALAGGRRGLEREGLRVTPAGRIVASPHPRSIGSALCNPHITTDYSESLLELVTPTFHGQRRAGAVPRRPASLRRAAARGGNALGRFHAGGDCRRARNTDRPVRALAPRALQGSLSARTADALWRPDAGDRRRALQLFLPGAILAVVGRPAGLASARHRVRVGALF